MEKTLLWEAFAALTATELRDLGKWVRSPFFNGRPLPISLFDYLDLCRRGGHTPNEAEAMDTLGLNGNALKLRQANTALLALLEQYLAYSEKFADGNSAKMNIAAAYRKRGLSKHFSINLREARTDREGQPWRHADYFHDLHLLEWEQYQHDAATKRTEPLNLQPASDFMDTAFVSRKLRLACLAKSHQAVFQTPYEIGLLDAALEAASQPQMLALPAVGLYYHCYRFQTDAAGAEKHFEAFRQLLAAHSAFLPDDELRTLYLLAINFGIKKINQSAEGWVQATLELYRGALARQLLVENGKISRFAFNNIVAIALRASEVDWVETFILEHKGLLERYWREATASLGLARVAFARRDFSAALLHLQRSDYKDHLNNLAAKTLQLKIYYECGEHELLDSHLKGMKNYIRRHTSIGYHRSNFGNTVAYAQRLISLNVNDKSQVEALRQEIAQEKILTEKEWFLEMLEP